MDTLKLKNVSNTEQHCMKTLGPDAKGTAVPRRGLIELTQAQFEGNSDVAGKIRLGIFRPVEPIPSWAVQPLKDLGVGL